MMMIFNEVYLSEYNLKLNYKKTFSSDPSTKTLRVYQNSYLLFEIQYDERINKINKEKIFTSGDVDIDLYVSYIIDIHKEIISKDINYGQPYNKVSMYIETPLKYLLIQDFFNILNEQNRINKIDNLLN
jgi:hypothetical protein